MDWKMLSGFWAQGMTLEAAMGEVLDGKVASPCLCARKRLSIWRNEGLIGIDGKGRLYGMDTYLEAVGTEAVLEGANTPLCGTFRYAACYGDPVRMA